MKIIKRVNILKIRKHAFLFQRGNRQGLLAIMESWGFVTDDKITNRKIQKNEKGNIKYICFVCLIWSVNGYQKPRKGAL